MILQEIKRLGRAGPFDLDRDACDIVTVEPRFITSWAPPAT
ncbi:hypothetical protein [Rhodomicrobium lacus]|nr:hypothetical protein [Rhodomicrobium lacus]